MDSLSRLLHPCSSLPPSLTRHLGRDKIEDIDSSDEEDHIYYAPDLHRIYYARDFLEQMPSLADPSRGAQRAVEKGAQGGLETGGCRQQSRPS